LLRERRIEQFDPGAGGPERLLAEARKHRLESSGIVCGSRKARLGGS